MPAGFPPNIVYPISFDDSSTLYLVYNSSQSVLSANLSAGNIEIPVVPVGADEDEIWADNGFITISGELIYYDLVEKNDDGKVSKFKRCFRNFDGEQGVYNPRGTPVMGFVVAEHSNQILNAIIATETFIGKNFDEDVTTLDWRIRNLQDTTRITDDFGCPEISLTIRTIESSPSTGTTIAYEIEIIGVIDTFLLEFGDGNTTTSTDSGEYTYAPSANIDPIIRAGHGDCLIIQTPIVRDSTTEPVISTTDNTLDINFPEVNIPDININVEPFELDVPVINVALPCLDTNFPSIYISVPDTINISPGIPSEITFIGDIPSIITLNGTIPDTIEVIGISDINIIGDFPSSISIEPFSIPDISFADPGIPSVITFGDVPSIPEVITIVGPGPLGPIEFGSPPTFPPIEFDSPPSFPKIEFEDAPTVTIDWGSPPAISVDVNVTCSGASMAQTANAFKSGATYLDDNTFLEEVNKPTVGAEVSFLGIPDTINLMVPDTLKDINLNHNLPEFIELKSDTKTIELIVPKTIELDCSGLKNIKLEGPEFIQLKMPEFPKLQFEEIPPLRFEKLPEIVVKLDVQNLIGESKEKGQCVQIVKCE